VHPCVPALTSALRRRSRPVFFLLLTVICYDGSRRTLRQRLGSVVASPIPARTFAIPLMRCLSQRAAAMVSTEGGFSVRLRSHASPVASAVGRGASPTNVNQSGHQGILSYARTLGRGECLSGAEGLSGGGGRRLRCVPAFPVAPRAFAVLGVRGFGDWAATMVSTISQTRLDHHFTPSATAIFALAARPAMFKFHW
jgi:hypothetical protein